MIMITIDVTNATKEEKTLGSGFGLNKTILSFQSLEDLPKNIQ